MDLWIYALRSKWTAEFFSRRNLQWQLKEQTNLITVDELRNCITFLKSLRKSPLNPLVSQPDSSGQHVKKILKHTTCTNRCVWWSFFFYLPFLNVSYIKALDFCSNICCRQKMISLVGRKKCWRCQSTLQNGSIQPNAKCESVTLNLVSFFFPAKLTLSLKLSSSQHSFVLLTSPRSSAVLCI